MSEDRPDRPLTPAELEEIETLLRSLEPGDLEEVQVPSHVWAGIQRQVEAAHDRHEGHGEVVELAGRRRSWTWMAAAAAAVILIVAGAFVVTGRAGDDDDTALSSAALVFDEAAGFDPLGAGASATAELLEADGFYEIKLTDAQLPAVSEADDLELWLIEPDASGAAVDVQPVSLVDPDEPGTYRVPPGLDPGTHYVVDISIEPRDGDAAHSGRSILRGPFEARASV